MRSASGTNVAFEHTVTTAAPPEAVWSLWTTPTTWGTWDAGLRQARTEGPFVVGARGVISPLRGPETQFEVIEIEDRRRCVYETLLPFARLRLERVLEQTSDGGTRFTHRVSFHGALCWLWAATMGRRFRALLPPTMERLAGAALAATSEAIS